jgi:Tol biopolymer transport system component
MNAPRSAISHGVSAAMAVASTVVAVVLLMAGSARAQSTHRVNVDSAGTQANGDCLGSNLWPSISANGQIVAFSNSATNLVPNDTNGRWDVFVHDRLTRLTERVSVGTSGAEGDGTSEAPYLSSDGTIVVFASAASNLVAGDTNGAWDIFVHDLRTGVTERVSIDSSGIEANGSSYSYLHFPRISGDGQVVVFASEATNLVANDTNGTWDTFVHDRSTGVTERVSVGSAGTESNGNSVNWSSISSDGRRLGCLCPRSFDRNHRAHQRRFVRNGRELSERPTLDFRGWASRHVLQRLHESRLGRQEQPP